jgi:hypothetical protein
MPAPARAFFQEATIEHYAPDPADLDGQRQLVGTTTVRCNLQPQWAREETANLDISQRSWNLYLPPGTALGHQDRVLVGDLQLEAVGAGRPMADFAGRPHHVEAVVRWAE